MRDKRVSPEDSVCTLVLVRHAAATGAGSFVGQNDEPLTPEGRRQLKTLVRKLSTFRFQTVFASDLERAVATAREAAESWDLKLEIRPNLREMHFGRWQGLFWKQIAKRDPRLANLWMKRFPSQPIPGGEQFMRFKNRIKTELKRIVDANRGRSVLVVTHAGVIRVALADALGMKNKNLFRLAQDPCAVNVLDYFPDGVTVRCVNG